MSNYLHPCIYSQSNHFSSSSFTVIVSKFKTLLNENNSKRLLVYSSQNIQRGLNNGFLTRIRKLTQCLQRTQLKDDTQLRICLKVTTICVCIIKQQESKEYWIQNEH